MRVLCSTKRQQRRGQTIEGNYEGILRENEILTYGL